MGDPNDWMTIGTHGGVGVAAGGLVGFLTRLFSSREAQEVATRLALIEQQLGALTKSLEQHAELSERVTRLEESARRRSRR